MALKIVAVETPKSSARRRSTLRKTCGTSAEKVLKTLASPGVWLALTIRPRMTSAISCWLWPLRA